MFQFDKGFLRKKEGTLTYVKLMPLYNVKIMKDLCNDMSQKLEYKHFA